MASSTPWTRRMFVHALGCLPALGGATFFESWASASSPRCARITSSPQFGFVASANDAIHVFRIAPGGAWACAQTVASTAPISLVLSPDQRFLYAANDVESFANLPAGSVEAYVVDPHDGSLTLLNRQRLALSATRPKHLAVSPDGRHLAVAVAGGAAYNLLPLRADGSIGRVAASMKEFGSGAHPLRQGNARPHAVGFQDAGTLLGIDPGTDRVSCFAVREQGALAVTQRYAAEPGSGPAHLAAHPGGRVLFLGGGPNPVVSSLRHEAGNKVPLRPLAQFQMPSHAGGITALAMHPSGSLLFAADMAGISVLRIDAAGSIALASRRATEVEAPIALAASADGEHLVALHLGGSVARFEIDMESGELSRPIPLAKVPRPMSIALKHF